MTRLVSDERGVTLIELLVTMVVSAIIMAAVVDGFVSGSRASADANARLGAQQNTRVALDRLEYEARCATGATAFGNQAGVTLTLPSQCTNAAGTVTWCVYHGSLMRYVGSSCSGTGEVFVTGVTGQTFSTPPPGSGDLPELDVSLTVNTAAGAADAVTMTDTIALRNAARG